MRQTFFALLVVAVVALGACGGGSDNSSRSTSAPRGGQVKRNPGPAKVKREIKAYKRNEDARLRTATRQWLGDKLNGAGGNKAWYRSIRGITVKHNLITVRVAGANGGRAAGRAMCDILLNSEIEGYTGMRVVHSPGRRVLARC